MRQICRKLLLIFVLVASIGMTLGVTNGVFAATKKLKTKTIKVGKSVNLTVKKNADWAISNTKVARMTAISMKKVKITGLQKGTTKITAKIGKTKYKATIKVKAGKKSSSGGSSNNVETLSSTKIPGSKDTAYYTSTGAKVIGHYDDAFANDLVARTNSYRSGSGSNTLTKSKVLTEAAKVRAAEAAVSFSHTRPDGRPYYSVSGTASNNYQDSAVYGENLAYGFANGSETMDAWENSTSHNANLLDNSFGSIGIGVLWVKQSDGSYVSYIGQEFGR